MIKVAVTHDVDRAKKTYHYFTKTVKAVFRGSLGASVYQVKSLFTGKNPYWTFDDLLEILNKYQIKSTFFFLNESMKFNPISPGNWALSLGRYNIQSKKIRDEIRRLKSEGHEIGVHGSFNSYKDLNLLKKEKSVLEDILGETIIGIRQHHLNLAENTWELQKKAGFKYDSSWGLNFSIGVEDDKTVPFKPFKDEFLVVPMSIMDAPFVSSEIKWRQFDEMIALVEKNNGVLVLNWHTDSLNDDEFPGYRSDFVKMLQILQSKNAEFFTMTQVYQQFSK
jgi:peptidoglycan/xylan/chitin deacetylase (PgdA/CDA1 family)